MNITRNKVLNSQIELRLLHMHEANHYIRVAESFYFELDVSNNEKGIYFNP